jgi:hypothetical protein
MILPGPSWNLLENEYSSDKGKELTLKCVKVNNEIPKPLVAA